MYLQCIPVEHGAERCMCILLWLSECMVSNLHVATHSSVPCWDWGQRILLLVNIIIIV